MITTELPADSDETSSSTKSGRRSTDLAANFVDGYAAGWFMAIPECFRSALDIQLTARVEKNPTTGEKRERMVSTEGRPPIYKFVRGDTLYNTKAVYDRAWVDALADVTTSFQVEEAEPDQPDGRASKIAGWIVLREYRPRPNRSGIDFVKKHRMTQGQFVSALKTGLLPGETRFVGLAEHP